MLSLHGAFVPNLKQFGYKIGIQFTNTPLFVKKTQLCSDECVGAAGQMFGINSSKAKTKFYLSLHYNGDDNSYLFVNGKKSVSLKQIIKLQTLKLNFAFLFNVESEEVSFKGNIYHFLVDYDAIDKYKILNIHKYLLVKNDIKYYGMFVYINVWNY